MLVMECESEFQPVETVEMSLHEEWHYDVCQGMWEFHPVKTVEMSLDEEWN